MLSLLALQAQLPWTIRYSKEFRANTQTQKDFTHTLLHISKAHGKLCGAMEDADHHSALLDDPEFQTKFKGYVADYVICALRLANVFPGGPINLAEAVETRLELKNGVTLDRSTDFQFDPAAILEMNGTEGTGLKPDPRAAEGPDDDDLPCGICLVSFVAGDRVIEDMDLGTVHLACCGPGRESYVKDIETGEPLGPDDPLPTGYIWNPDRGGRSAGQ